jgi:hypothetical protein
MKKRKIEDDDSTTGAETNLKFKILDEYEYGWELRQQFKYILPHYSRKKNYKSGWVEETDNWLRQLIIRFPRKKQ